MKSFWNCRKCFLKHFIQLVKSWICGIGIISDFLKYIGNVDFFTDKTIICIHIDYLNMKFHGWQNPLHRKKLHLALHCLRGSPTDPYLVMAGALDTAWVLRWLDDAGLPQHKDTFLAARVDGRLLHRLTLEELAGLHVTSVLHAASIRTGIQVCTKRPCWL